MYVGHLSLTNFRNYTRLELELPPGVTLLHGDNAQGKTNLLEALYYLATTRSPHAAQDQQMLNWEALAGDEPLVVGRLVTDISRADGPRHLEMRLILEGRGGRPRLLSRNGQATFRREALVNRRKVRLMDLLGELRVVLFLPEDVQLVTAAPAERRRYMNITLCQVDPAYCRALSAYNKVLEQRNALLRRMAEGSIAPGGAADLLNILTEKLIEPGAAVLARRAGFLTEMAREMQRIHYEDLMGGRETLRLCYLPGRLTDGREESGDLIREGEWLQERQGEPGAVAERLAEALRRTQRADMARGATGAGPHRDDWLMLVNGQSLGQFGSRGQQRTAVLALKLAEIEWMLRLTDDAPLLLLDEVIAELDLKRRGALLAYIADLTAGRPAAQALLTATDPGMFTPEFLAGARLMTVGGGRVSPDRAD